MSSGVARRGRVVDLEFSVASDFVAHNHQEGMAGAGKNVRSLGLVVGGELVAVAIFCNPRTLDKQREYTTELLRLAFKDGVRVLGWGSKLLKHFMDSPRSVDLFTYQDVSGLAGYCLEGVAGDRVYEWRNPNVKFYTYKITSQSDSSYYYGRHRTSVGVTEEEMLTDGYFGSGGVKFQNWVRTVGVESLRKVIVGVHDTWGEAVKAEEELIGDLYMTDVLCKNSKPGGVGLGGYFPKHELKQCPVHGESLHQGVSCKKCVSSRTYVEGECPVHGSVLLQGENCPRCQADKARGMKLCAKHGESKHVGKSCSKCVSESTFGVQECETHGRTTHMGGTCKKCVVGESLNQKECEVHGLTTHLGDTCRKCVAESMIHSEVCSVHGESPHQGKSCLKCSSSKRVVEGDCERHGRGKFIGVKCATCLSQSLVSSRECPVHGLSKHVGEKCRKCLAALLWAVEDCRVHGLVKHRKSKCVTCAVRARRGEPPDLEVD